MKVITIKLTELKRPEKNLRLHTDKQLREFERSIEMFGQIRPIVVDENNVMLAGNGLYEALSRMGRTEASCYVMKGLSETQKKKLMLADNRIFDLGVDDMAAFDSFILELKDDLDVPGFDEDMLKSLVMDTSEADDLISGYGVIPEDRAEEIRQTKARYEERDEATARSATEVMPSSPAPEAPEASESSVGVVREETGYAAPFKADEQERKYIVCPKCGERLWL